MIRKCRECDCEILDSYDGHGAVEVLSLEMEYRYTICPRCALYGFKRVEKDMKPRHTMTERKCSVCGKMYVPTCANSKTCSDECRKKKHLIYTKRYEKRLKQGRVNGTDKAYKTV